MFMLLYLNVFVVWLNFFFLFGIKSVGIGIIIVFLMGWFVFLFKEKRKNIYINF